MLSHYYTSLQMLGVFMYDIIQWSLQVEFTVASFSTYCNDTVFMVSRVFGDMHICIKG